MGGCSRRPGSCRPSIPSIGIVLRAQPQFRRERRVPKANPCDDETPGAHRPFQVFGALRHAMQVQQGRHCKHDALAVHELRLGVDRVVDAAVEFDALDEQASHEIAGTKRGAARAHPENDGERGQRRHDDEQHGRGRAAGEVEDRKLLAVDEGREHIRAVGGPAAGQDIDHVEYPEGVGNSDHQDDGDDGSKKRQGYPGENLPRRSPVHHCGLERFLRQIGEARQQHQDVERQRKPEVGDDHGRARQPDVGKPQRPGFRQRPEEPNR